jgi:SAM-dependent methyltransferase
MSDLDTKAHWEAVYRDRLATDVSWYQREPRLSLRMIDDAGLNHDAAVIDVGGGASVLVDRLIDKGFTDLTVLDVSSRALAQARERLGARADRVAWLVTDVTRYRPERLFDLWHDRAAFHFLTAAEDRARYVAVLDEAVKADGRVVIAAFAPDGPRQCSGLPIVRYDGPALAAALGPGYRLEDEARETHLTPAGREQRFGFYRFRRLA